MQREQVRHLWSLTPGFGEALLQRIEHHPGLA
jgi:hypothetical protein